VCFNFTHLLPTRLLHKRQVKPSPRGRHTLNAFGGQVDKLQAMQVFVKVVDGNSFSGAADALGMTRSSVSTIIQNLEAFLKVRLLNRTTRRLSLTPDGAAYYERSAQILADVAETENSLSSRASTPRGKLRVDMPGAIGRLVIVPVLAEFMSLYPEVEIMVGINDRQDDLVLTGIDCSLRVGTLPDSSLVARCLGATQFLTVASPGYLARRGIPKTISDLEKHDVVNFCCSVTGRCLDVGFAVDGRTVSPRWQSRLGSTDSAAHLEFGLQGCGILQLPRFLALQHLNAGNLIELLPHCRPEPLPVHAVYPQSRHLAPQVRAFVDWVIETFAHNELFQTRDSRLSCDLMRVTKGVWTTPANCRPPETGRSVFTRDLIEPQVQKLA
jgi:LysR family transcriptional regulator for bpeEF and oprC